MRKKLGLFWFAAALLGAALIFAGCETEADTETKYVAGEMIHLDTVVANVTALKAALEVEGDLAIGFTGTSNNTLTEALVVDAGKVVYILSQGTLATDTGGKDLKVAGIVYVGAGGTLDTSAGNVIVEEGGSVSVLSGKSVVPGGGAGTLKVADEDSVFNGETGADAATVLGTNKVWIGGTLKYTTGPFANVAALTVPFSYVGNGGTLDISDVTVPGSTPSTLVAAIPQGQNLIAKAAADEAVTTPLTIPANADITLASSDTLATITGLTVNGSLTTVAVTATLAAATSVTVSGTLDIGANTDLTLAAASTTGVTTTGKGKIVSATATTAVLKALLDKAGSALVIEQSGSVNFADDQTVKAGTTLISTGAITVTAGKTLTLNGSVDVTGGSLVLATTAAANVGKISGTGSIVAGATTITGAWEAGTATTAAGSLTITGAAAGATITGDGTNAKVLKASTGGGTITQDAGSGNKLTIGADTTIDLGGNATKLGEIVLKNSAETNATNNGKLTLIGTITTGNATGSVTAQPLSTDGATTASGTSYTLIGVTNLIGDGSLAKIEPTNAPVSGAAVAGKIVKLTGAANATITGGNATATVDGTADGKISGETITNATAS